VILQTRGRKEMMMGMRVGSSGMNAAMQQIRQTQSAPSEPHGANQKTASPVAAATLSNANDMQTKTISALLSSLGSNLDVQA
jgi:hypothetical protein